MFFHQLFADGERIAKRLRGPLRIAASKIRGSETVSGHRQIVSAPFAVRVEPHHAFRDGHRLPRRIQGGRQPP